MYNLLMFKSISLFLLCLISLQSLAGALSIGGLSVTLSNIVSGDYGDVVVKKIEGGTLYSNLDLWGRTYIVTTHLPEFMGVDYAVEPNNTTIFPLYLSNLTSFNIPNHENKVIAFVESTYGTGGGRQRFVIIDTVTGEVAEQTVSSFDPIIWDGGVVFQSLYTD